MSEKQPQTGNSILQEVIDRTRRMEIKLTSIAHQLGVDPSVDCRKLPGHIAVDAENGDVFVSNPSVELSAVASAMRLNKLNTARLHVAGADWGVINLGVPS